MKLFFDFPYKVRLKHISYQLMHELVRYMKSVNMHGEKLKVINAKQAKMNNIYKNTKYKLLNLCMSW